MSRTNGGHDGFFPRIQYKYSITKSRLWSPVECKCRRPVPGRHSRPWAISYQESTVTRERGNHDCSGSKVAKHDDDDRQRPCTAARVPCHPFVIVCLRSKLERALPVVNHSSLSNDTVPGALRYRIKHLSCRCSVQYSTQYSTAKRVVNHLLCLHQGPWL